MLHRQPCPTPSLRARTHLGLGLLLACTAATAANAQAGGAGERVVVDCRQDAPADLMGVFGQPSVRDLWQARKQLADWEARPDIKALLDELEKTELDARRYFASLEQVAISRTPTFKNLPADLRRFVLDKTAENAGLRGTPEKYLALVNQLMLAGGDDAIANFVRASRTAAADVEAHPPELGKSADPVAAASALERQTFSAWTVHCEAPLRVFTERTKAPIPTNFFLRNEPQAAVFMTSAVPELLKMRHDQAKSLVDNLWVLHGQAPITSSLSGPNLYPMMKQAVQDAVPKMLTRIAGMKEAELKQLDQLTIHWNMPGGWAYSQLAQQPAVKQAIADRRTELDGLAPQPSDLPFPERARRNLPPTRDELIRYITSEAMADTQQSNKMEFIRTGDNTFDDYNVKPLLGRIRTGETRVDVMNLKCQPAPKGRKCSFSVNLVRTYYLGSSELSSKGLGLMDYSGVIRWGAHGLVSSDLNVGGWVRRYSSGGGSSSSARDDSDRDALNSGLAERAAAARERREEAQRRYNEDQDARRERNRSCGPAPNICH